MAPHALAGDSFYGMIWLAVGASKCAKLDIQHSCLWDSCCPTLRQVHLIPQVSFNCATRLQEEYWILQVSLLVLQAFCSLYLLGLQKLVGGEKLAVFRGPCIKVAFKVTSTKTSKGKKMTLQSTFWEALQMEDPKIIKTYFHVMLNWEPMVLGYCRYPKFWALTDKIDVRSSLEAAVAVSIPQRPANFQSTSSPTWVCLKMLGIFPMK